MQTLTKEEMMQRKISIAYFATTGVRAGAEEHILSLIRQLDRRCFNVYLACPAALAQALQPDLPSDVTVLKVYVERPTQVGAASRLATFLRCHHIDIVHSHQFRASLVASPLAKLCGVPVTIETPHVRELWRRGWKSHFVVDRLAGRFVDYYIAVSESNARYLTKVKGLPEKKVRVIHNGIDLSQFNPAHVAPQIMRQALGLDPHDRVVLLMGRLEPQKGHMVLLEALAHVRHYFPRLRLICAGEGSLRNELQQRTEALGLSDAVRFVGYQSNVRDWLALADFSVLPSFYEGLPLAAIESLAAGRTMIATAVDGTPEVVVNEQTGLIVPPGDPNALAAAITRLLREPALRHRLAEAGREFVLERFSCERQIQKTQDLYIRAFDEKVSRGVRQFHECLPDEPHSNEVLPQEGVTTTLK